MHAHIIQEGCDNSILPTSFLVLCHSSADPSNLPQGQGDKS